ncbi:MAG: PAS domain S-box protein [Salinibacter sp.]|uniref:PAS domain S-box protein n=1 Tax=Salinibacter sp. TaxID=2065818 RepID=UPI0035D403ED
MSALNTRFWGLLFPSGTREQDPDFRSVLTDILHTGLRQCGAIGLVGSLLYVGLGVFGLGYELNWTYRAFRTTGLDDRIVVVGTLIVSALSVFGLVLAQMECSLQTGRWFGAGAVLLTASVATFEGALRGVFGTEYVLPIYLVTVAVVPFRPSQVLGMGGTVAVVVYVLGPSGLAWEGLAAPTAEMAKHLVLVGGSSFLITGASRALYRRYRAFGDAQASLQKNRDLLRRVQAVAEVGGWEYDPETGEADGTDELHRILDLPDEAVLGGDMGLRLQPAEARRTVRAAIERCLNGDGPVDVETPIDTAGGDRRWVHIRGRTRERYDGSVRLVGTLQDITERHEMEEQLREQEQQLRSITENVSDGIFRLTPGHGLVFANEAFARMFGYESTSEVLAADPTELHVRSDDQSVFFWAAETSSAPQEVRFRRKDGSTFTGLLNGTVVRDELSGMVKHVDGAVTDITALKEREEQLQRERDRFETLFQNLPTPVVQGVLVDGGTRVQTVNREFEEVFGCDARSVQGTNMSSLIGPENDSLEMEELIRTASAEGPLHTKVSLETLDGVRDFQLYFAAHHQGDQQRAEGYAMLVDVTERERREQALREREQKVGALYTATERLFRAKHREEVVERLEGLVDETFGGSFSTAYFPEGNGSVPARMSSGADVSKGGFLSNGASVEADVIEACRSGETVVTENLHDADLPVDADHLQGAAFLPVAEHGLLLVGHEEADGLSSFDLRLLEILSTHASAVLDRLDHEHDLRRSQQQFRGIFENAVHGIVLMGADGTILKTNPAFRGMLDLEAEDLRGRTFRNFMRSADPETSRRLFSELVAGERESYEVEHRFTRDDEQGFWGALTVSRHAGPGPIEAIGMVENIDDRRRRNQALREAKEEAEKMNRLKSAFLANMSHEIRTPLTSILGFAEAIGDAVSDDPSDADAPIGEFSRLIAKSGTRLLETLDSVLDLSKLEADSMDFSPTVVDLTDEARGVVDTFEQRAASAGVALQTDLPDTAVRACVDQGALRRVQRNLISNALKYTEEGGHAWVRVRQADEAAVLEIEDTGIGMESDQVADLFDAFAQASTGTDRSYEGSGLGLAIVDRLVDRMNGSIEVDTEKGVGTCFTIRLPQDARAAVEEPNE